MIRRPPRSTLDRSSAASDVYKRQLQDMVEKQINGAYPDAHIKEVEDYNIFETDGKVAFERLILKKADYLPIKAYKDFALSLIHISEPTRPY